MNYKLSHGGLLKDILEREVGNKQKVEVEDLDWSIFQS